MSMIYDDRYNSELLTFFISINLSKLNIGDVNSKTLFVLKELAFKKVVSFSYISPYYANNVQGFLRCSPVKDYMSLWHFLRYFLVEATSEFPWKRNPTMSNPT